MIVIAISIIMCDSMVREAGVPLGRIIVIFIDKFNISGIEMMILTIRCRKSAHAPAIYWRGGRQRRTILIFIVEGWPRLESPPKES